MVAALSVRVYTGTNAATESAAQTGIDLISADNATNTSGNRTSNPVTVNTNSFEKHLRLKIDTSPANGVTNFQWWTPGSGTTNVALRAKEAIGTGGATPGTGDSTPTASAMGSDIDAYTRSSGSKGTWDATSYVTQNNVTKALLLQLQPATAANPGNWTETISFSYDETAVRRNLALHIEDGLPAPHSGPTITGSRFNAREFLVY